MTTIEEQTSADDWDGERGKAIDSSQWLVARRVIAAAKSHLSHAVPAFVSACGDGTVHLCWTKSNGDRAILEIGRGEYWWSVIPIASDEDTIEQLESPYDALARLRQWRCDGGAV